MRRVASLFLVVMTLLVAPTLHPTASACSVVVPTAWRVFDGRAVRHVRLPGGDGRSHAWTFEVLTWRDGTTGSARPARMTVLAREASRGNLVQRVWRRLRGRDAGDCAFLDLRERSREGATYRVRAGAPSEDGPWNVDMASSAGPGLVRLR